MALQGSDHSDESDEDQKEEDRYCDDPAYRLQCGPNIERFGDFGYDESLVGLQLSLPFGHGECRGTVTGTTKCKYGQQMLARGMNMAPKQLGAAFEQCKQSTLGKHSFVMYEMDPPPGRAPCRIDGEHAFDIEDLA